MSYVRNWDIRASDTSLSGHVCGCCAPGSLQLFRRKLDGLQIKAKPSHGWEGWMKTWGLPEGQGHRIEVVEFDRDFEYIGQVLR